MATLHQLLVISVALSGEHENDDQMELLSERGVARISLELESEGRDRQASLPFWFRRVAIPHLQNLPSVLTAGFA